MCIPRKRTENEIKLEKKVKCFWYSMSPRNIYHHKTYAMVIQSPLSKTCAWYFFRCNLLVTPKEYLINGSEVFDLCDLHRVAIKCTWFYVQE